MDSDDHDRKTYSGRDARQGSIILRTPARRAIFVAGLAGFVILLALGTCVPVS